MSALFEWWFWHVWYIPWQTLQHRCRQAICKHSLCQALQNVWLTFGSTTIKLVPNTAVLELSVRRFQSGDVSRRFNHQTHSSLIVDNRYTWLWTHSESMLQRGLLRGSHWDLYNLHSTVLWLALWHTHCDLLADTVHNSKALYLLCWLIQYEDHSCSIRLLWVDRNALSFMLEIYRRYRWHIHSSPYQKRMWPEPESENTLAP